MGPDPVYNTGVCRLVWSGGETSEESQANLFVQCIFFILQVSVSHHMYIKRIQANPGNGLLPGMVAGKWMGKERTKSFVRVFVQCLWLFPGLRLMLGTWPSCGVHRVTDLGHQIPPEPCRLSLPAACSSDGSPKGQ